MTWKDDTKVQKRREFVLRAKEPGANISALCREYNISRKTGYKWLHRFEERGLLGLQDRPRSASSTPFKCSVEVSLDTVKLKLNYPHFGPKKLRQLLLKRYSQDEVPSVSTISRIVRYMGLTKQKRRTTNKYGPQKRPEVVVEAPNDLWTVDFKGWFRTKDRKRCEPLTVRDQFSRFILAIDICETPSTEQVKPVFVRLFERYGLPKVIQSDNGSPFATTRSRTGLTQLSAWWVALGIRFVRSRVGKPQDNGGHERMHRDIKAQLQRNPAATPAQQQELCNTFRHVFNYERPHEALEQRMPGDVYRTSSKVFTSPDPVLVYPAHMHKRRVTAQGAIRYKGFFNVVGRPFAGNYVGVEQIDDKSIRVWFGDLCIGTTELPWRGPLRAAGQYREQQP